MQYRLVMKENNNNYLPFDLHLLDSYNGEDLNTLSGIDEFTCKYNNEIELKQDLLRANFMDIEDIDKEIKIIFYENEANREYKYGILYKEMKEYIDSTKLIEFIKYNIHQPLILNRLFNEFNKKKYKSTFLIAVLDVLKNVKKCDDINNIYYINLLPYEEKRSLAMFIYHNFYDIIKQSKESDNDGIRRIRKEPKAS